jgi:hypothetical protein
MCKVIVVVVYSYLLLRAVSIFILESCPVTSSTTLQDHTPEERYFQGEGLVTHSRTLFAREARNISRVFPDSALMLSMSSVASCAPLQLMSKPTSLSLRSNKASFPE